MLPASFPENFEIKASIPSSDPSSPPTTKKFVFSYPCVLLNKMVQRHFTNHQYQTLKSDTGMYETRSENSIFFEVFFFSFFSFFDKVTNFLDIK